VPSLSDVVRLAESILEGLEPYIRRNICWDEASPYYGGLIETVPHTPHPTWPHASYRVASAYLRLYEAYGDESYWRVARVMVDYLVREQTEAGCWFGYAGFPKSAGWSEKSAPPGSKLNVRMEDGTVLDIIRSPFSIFGTALYGKVIADAMLLAEELDPERARRWREAFLMAAEFVRCMIDDRGYWVTNRAWNQRAAVAVILATASKLLGPERYLRKARIILDQVLSAQLESGEYPYSEHGGRTYHYHALTLYYLNQFNEVMPDERIRESVMRGLRWMWGMQTPSGDFDWSIHDPRDHKTRLTSTFGVALQATAPYVRAYLSHVHRALAFLKGLQSADGGFPLKIGLPGSNTTHSGDVLLGLAELLRHARASTS